MLDWFKDHETLVAWLTAISVVVLVASSVAAGFVVLRIPADYFAHDRRPPREGLGLPRGFGAPMRVLKNVVGAVLVAAGAVMLVVPGQGVLTMLIGVFLLDIPGKYRAEKWAVRRKGVLRSLNWFRRKFGKPAFVLEEGQTGAKAAPA